MEPQQIRRTVLGTGALISGVTFSEQMIVDTNSKGVTFENCIFSAAIIIRGYFHGAKFKKCKFIGTRFDACNFRQATFDQCSFDYADFHRTILPIPQVLANLPVYSNVRWELIHNLKANQTALGDTRFDDELLRQEILAEISHWKDVRRRPTSYYNKYNNIKDQSIAWLQCRRLWIERYIWGHGESLGRLTLATIIALFFLSVCDVLPRTQGTATVSNVFDAWVSSLQFVCTLFIDLPVTPEEADASATVSTITLVVRYLYIGMAVPVLYKKISKR